LKSRKICYLSQHATIFPQSNNHICNQSFASQAHFWALLRRSVESKVNAMIPGGWLDISWTFSVDTLDGVGRKRQKSGYKYEYHFVEIWLHVSRNHGFTSIPRGVEGGINTLHV
jgi:hypothetical protein